MRDQKRFGTIGPSGRIPQGVPWPAWSNTPTQLGASSSGEEFGTDANGVVGGVAGGMSTATRLRRLDEHAQITVVEKSGHVSYANCGLPYFVGGVIEREEDLLLQTPDRLFDRFRLDVRVHSEVIAIDAAARTVTVRVGAAGTAQHDDVIPYDQLVLRPGAVAVRRPNPRFDRVRVLRTVEDAAALAGDVDRQPATAVVIGAGFIGLETAENLNHGGIDVTVVEAAPQVAQGERLVAGQKRRTLLVKLIEMRPVLPPDHQCVGKARRCKECGNGTATLEQGIRRHRHAMNDDKTRRGCRSKQIEIA